MPTQTFTILRATWPDPVGLAAAYAALVGDSAGTVVRSPDRETWFADKATPWSAADIAAVQNLLMTAPVLSPTLGAQRTIDAWPIETKALLLTLLDQINVLRAGLPNPLGAITPAQALAAVRAKAGTL